MPYYEDDQITLHHGDSLEVLRTLPGDSVDAVVTDPPYELGFMGKTWDATGIAYSVDLWREALRVLKPGGHLLAFGGTRTVHRMTCAIEDAGFEVRDGIDWLYGSGFPKSLDVSKAIDKTARGEMVRAKLLHFATERGINGRWLEAQGVASAASFTDWTVGGHVPSDRNWQLVKVALAVTVDEEAAFERAAVGQRSNGIASGTGRHAGMEGAYGFAATYDVTTAATAAAGRWEGWGTALKPAREPIVMARKPLAGTVAANVLTCGTGALNIGACRVPHADDLSRYERSATSGYKAGGVYGDGDARLIASAHTEGRWPTNVVLSHAGNDVDGDVCADGCVPGCAVAELDRQSGVTSSGSRKAGTYGLMGYMGADAAPMPAIAGDSGGASRFFPVFRYEAKAPTSERPKVDGEAHATVKPLALMRWLVQLVTPPGGLVLEPFAGSGTTVEACLVEGYRCIAVEREAKYLPLIMSRITKPIESVLFGVLDECEGAE